MLINEFFVYKPKHIIFIEIQKFNKYVQNLNNSYRLS